MMKKKTRRRPLCSEIHFFLSEAFGLSSWRRYLTVPSPMGFCERGAAEMNFQKVSNT